MPFKVLVDWFHWVFLKRRTPFHREELLLPSWILSPVLDTIGLMKIPQTFSLTFEKSNLCIKIDFFWGEKKSCSICSKWLEHKHHRMYRNEGQVFLEIWELILRKRSLGQWTQELWTSQWKQIALKGSRNLPQSQGKRRLTGRPAWDTGLVPSIQEQRNPQWSETRCLL